MEKRKICFLHKKENIMAEKFLVETSARHVHLTDADIETLFGKGAKLTHKKVRPRLAGGCCAS